MARDKIRLNQDLNQGKQYGPGAKQYSIRAMLEYLVALQTQPKSPNKQKWADNNQNKQQQSNLSIVNILKQSFENILNLLKKRSEKEDKQNILIKKYTENVLKKLDTLNNTINNKQFTLERSNNLNNKLNEETIANFLKNFDNNILTSIRDNLKIFNEKISSNLSNSSTSTSTSAPITSNIVIDVSNLETILSDNNKSFKEILNDIQKQYTDIQNKLNLLNTKDTNNIGNDSAILANGLAAIYKYFDTNNDYLRQINGKIENFDFTNSNNNINNSNNTNNSNIIIDDNSIKINIDDSELLKNIDNKLQQLVENKSTNNTNNSITNTEISNITVQNEKPKVLADENYNVFFEKLNDYLKNTYESKINSITSTNSIIQRSLYKNGFQVYSRDTIYNEVSSIKTSINNFFKDYDISKLIQELKSNSEQQNKDKKISEENKQNKGILTSEQPEQSKQSETPKTTELPKGEPVSPSELEVTQETLTGEQPVISITTPSQNTLQGQVITLGSNLNTQNEVTSPESTEPIITINPQNVEQQKLSDLANSTSILVKPLPSMDELKKTTEIIDNTIFVENAKPITIASDIQQPIPGLNINSIDKPKLESKELIALNLINENVKQILEKISGHFTFIKDQTDKENLYKDSLLDNQSLEKILMGTSGNGSTSISSSDLSLVDMLKSSDGQEMLSNILKEALEDNMGGPDILTTMLGIDAGKAATKHLLGGIFKHGLKRAPVRLAAKFGGKAGVRALPKIAAGAGTALAAAELALIGYGLYDGWNNADQITGIDKEKLVFGDKFHAANVKALSMATLGLVDAKTLYNITNAIAELPDAEEQERIILHRKKLTETRLKHDKESEKELDKATDKTGINDDYSTIVAKAHVNGIDSLTEYQKLIYNSLERDEFGNLKRTAGGNYKLDSKKAEDVQKWMGNKENVKNASIEDVQAMRKQSEFFNTNYEAQLKNELITDTVTGSKKNKGKFTYIDKNGRDQQGMSILGLKFEQDKLNEEADLGAGYKIKFLDDENWINSLKKDIKTNNIKGIDEKIAEVTDYLKKFKNFNFNENIDNSFTKMGVRSDLGVYAKIPFEGNNLINTAGLRLKIKNIESLIRTLNVIKQKIQDNQQKVDEFKSASASFNGTVDEVKAGEGKHAVTSTTSEAAISAFNSQMAMPPPAQNSAEQAAAETEKQVGQNRQLVQTVSNSLQIGSEAIGEKVSLAINNKTVVNPPKYPVQTIIPAYHDPRGVVQVGQA